MQDGKIVYFEDSEILAETTKAGIDLFGRGRHRIIAHAADLVGALSVLDQVASGEIDANIVLTDGTLSPGVGGRDAREIIERVGELGLNVRTVLMSSQSAEEIGVKVDVAIDKGSADARSTGLVSILDSLPELEV